MATNFIETRKRQKNLILIFIILVLFAIAILLSGFFKKFLKKTEIVTPELREIKINFEVLENPILKELQSFEKIKPYEGKIGRQNPFIP